jgi:Tol biopolymer transport system component
MDIEGKDRRMVIEGEYSEPDWSPDGQWLVFISEGTLMISDTKGDSIRVFSGIKDVPLHSPDWSIDGHYILCASTYLNGGGFFEITPDYGKVKLLFDQYRISGAEPAWSNDRSMIVFQKLLNNWEWGEIYIIDTAGNSEKRLTNSDRDDRDPSWSYDGKMIAWSSSNRIYIMEADGNNQKMLTYGKDPSWCPDSGKIVYSFANKDYSQEVLWIMDVDGKNKRQLTF